MATVSRAADTAEKGVYGDLSKRSLSTRSASTSLAQRFQPGPMLSSLSSTWAEVSGVAVPLSKDSDEQVFTVVFQEIFHSPARLFEGRTKVSA